MLTNGPNIYQAARKESCLTQEQAVERLGVSETTVKAWEQGARVPDNETVARMAELYGTPWLALEHLKQAGGALGVLPEVTVQSLPTAAITLINWVLDFAERHRDRQLLRIAEDGIIDETERPDFDDICRDLDGIVGAALLTTAANTVAIWLDSVFWGYYSFAYVFGATASRLVAGVVTAVLMATASIPLVRMLRGRV